MPDLPKKKTTKTKTADVLKTAVHWGFIPAIIVVGMTCTEPRPTVGQLVGF
jgi:import receptor subunit TOM7